MDSDNATNRASGTPQQGSKAVSQGNKSSQQGSTSVQLTGNQRLERQPQSSSSSDDGTAHQSTALAPGTQAPKFTLHTTPDQEVALDDFKGKRLILVFYPADWSPVCGDELAIFNEVVPEFHKHNAELVGISVDGVWCHIAYAKHNRLHFPLLSDFEPKGEVARDYGVYRKREGVSERALFLIDEQGTIRWSYVSPIGVNPGADGVFDALEELESREKQKGAAA